MPNIRQERGFSLVELVTVMSIMAILLTVATLQFNSMQKKAAVERDTQTIYSNLMSVRLQALYTKTPRTVTFIGNSFSTYSSATTTAAPVSTQTLSYPVVMNSGTNRIDFDASGMMLSAERSICVDPTGNLADNPGNVDSVDVATAKIFMGKRKSGGACAPDSIDQK